MYYNIKNKAWLLIFNSIIITGISIFITACPTPPEFEDIPKIEFENLQYTQETSLAPGGQILTEDVLSLTIYFEDGDGDLGLRDDEFGAPYQLFDLELDENGDLIFFGSQPNLPPYNYYDYFVANDSIVINNTTLINDTIFVSFNERHFNIYVSFFYKVSENADFQQFEWERLQEGNYQSFHGRFPILNTEDYDRPLNGSLTYEMKSSGFQSIFRDYPMYLEVYILDRSGNKSNTVRTETVRLINPQ